MNSRMNRSQARLMLIAGASILLLWGCGSSAPSVHRDNLAYLYGKGPSNLRVQARVYHEGPESSLIHYKLNTADLLYKADGAGGPFKAQVRVTYSTYSDASAKHLLDSASTLVTDKSETPGQENELIGTMELRRRPGTNFTVIVTARDLNRDNESSLLLNVDADPLGSSQYYMPIDPENGLPLFSDHIRAGRRVSVRCDRCSGDSIHIVRRPIAAGLPSPVFSGDAHGRADLTPDSGFTVLADASGRIDLGMPRVGTYLLRSGNDSVGFALHVLEKTYPYVDHSTDMLAPLRYITSTQEFDRMANDTNVRKAVERFWIDATGDRERARDAIRIYYGRVENANRHFSADVEGWRTDRGLVHIIFGSPTTIYRGANGETWIYGEESNLMSLTFNFTRRRSAITGNDYVLQRDPMLKGAWYRNVESWRNGRVYQN